MKNVVLAAPALAAALLAADPAGKWTGTIDVPDTGSGTIISTPVDAVFERREGRLTGRIGRKGDPNAEPVRNAVSDGRSLTFEVTSPETASAMRFTLAIDGGRMTGEMKGRVEGAGEIVGKVALPRAAQAASAPKPNIVLIFTDDQGYGDAGCYGSPDIATPNLDRMAAEGIRFTDFYAQPFCGPSRAALMTGSYPPRVSLMFNHSPKARTGIHRNEVTIAEILKGQGYRTMIIGKWHLGDAPEFLPTRQGFDRFFGLPYSNDMWPYHPLTYPEENEHPRLTAARKRAEHTGYAGRGTPYPKGGGFPDLPLMSNEEVLEWNPDQTKLTRTYTEKALSFIAENKDVPFFLYLAHNMPHVPLFASEGFRGKSKRGLYGDVVEEIDWSVGAVLAKLKQLGLDEKTLVVFTSDNGPWLPYGIDGGSAGPLRNGKGTHWEGGMRVPAIARWPGRIPPGRTTSAVAANLDLLPTFSRLAGGEAPRDRVIDGRDLWPLLSGEKGAKSPHEAFYYYAGARPGAAAPLKAIRSGKWKLHLRNDGTGEALYDLETDIGERKDRLPEFPEVGLRLAAMAKGFDNELRRNVRPLGGKE
jgi:arylsulfatase A-like enzyme